MVEQDPEKCNALESSLWELKTLQNHYHHFIAKKAGKFSHAMQPEETPLDDLLEIQTSQVSYNKAVKEVGSERITVVPKLADLTYAHTLVIKSTCIHEYFW